MAMKLVSAMFRCQHHHWVVEVSWMLNLLKEFPRQTCGELHVHFFYFIFLLNAMFLTRFRVSELNVEFVEGYPELDPLRSVGCCCCFFVVFFK